MNDATGGPGSWRWHGHCPGGRCGRWSALTGGDRCRPDHGTHGSSGPSGRGPAGARSERPALHALRPHGAGGLEGGAFGSGAGRAPLGPLEPWVPWSGRHRSPPVRADQPATPAARTVAVTTATSLGLPDCQHRSSRNAPSRAFQPIQDRATRKVAATSAEGLARQRSHEALLGLEFHAGGLRTGCRADGPRLEHAVRADGGPLDRFNAVEEREPCGLPGKAVATPLAADGVGPTLARARSPRLLGQEAHGDVHGLGDDPAWHWQAACPAERGAGTRGWRSPPACVSANRIRDLLTIRHGGCECEV